jgi:hypothetical protein
MSVHELNFSKHKRISIITTLRKKYNGNWIYNRRAHIWEKEDGGHACWVCRIGGHNGDDYLGSDLYYYPKNGTPEIVYR